MHLRPSEQVVTSIVKENTANSSPLPTPSPEQFIKINHLSAILRDLEYDLPYFSDKKTDIFILTEVSRIINELDSFGIKSAVIKSLPVVAKPIGDIDILVGDLEKAGEVLTNNSYDVSVDPDPHKLLCLSTMDGVLINIHLHGEIAWRKVIYLDPIETLDSIQTRTFYGIDFPVVSPEFEVLIIAAHMLYERGNMRISLHNVLELSLLFSSNDVSISFLIKTASKHGWMESLCMFLNASSSINYQLFGDYFNISHPELTKHKYQLSYNPFFFNWNFSIRKMIQIRARKVFNDLVSRDLGAISNDFSAYPRDIIKVFTERYGVINTKRRFYKWKNIIQSTI